MPTLIIDGKEISVQPGATIMEAAKLLGVAIPHFCYHPKLSTSGNCRMCLVEVEKMPKPVVSCAMPVNDGMVVKTDSEMVQKARKGVMEFLLINHPLDCPVCDQGGECSLQDLAMKYGPDRSRYHEQKRNFPNYDLGPLIETEMNRCIHCTRCMRFSTEIAGVEEMGAVYRGDHMQVGPFVEKTLSSEMAGNLAELCPVGALNLKPFHFSARGWELKRTEGICSHCSVGCHTRVDHLNDQVKRVMARSCDTINQTWLCDKGRFSYDGLTEDRLTSPTTQSNGGDPKEVSWAEALDQAADILKSVKPSEVAGLASDTNQGAEELFAFQDFIRNVVGSTHLDHRLRQRDFSGDDALLTRADLLMNTPLAKLNQADLVILVGSDVRFETPLLNLRLRQATQKGARAFAIGPRQQKNNLVNLTDVVLRPGSEGDFLAQTLAAMDAPGNNEQANQLATALKQSKQPALILGDYGVRHPDAESLRRHSVALLDKAGALSSEWNGFNRVAQQGNAAAAQDLGVVPHRGPGYKRIDNRGQNAAQILESAAQGTIKVLFLLGTDPTLESVDTTLARKALGKAKVIYLGAYNTPAAKLADVVLPGLTINEREATFTNMEGRAQRSLMAVMGPIQCKEDWRIFRSLSDRFAHPLGYNTREALQETIGKADHRYQLDGGNDSELSLACDHSPVTTGLKTLAASEKRGGMVLVIEPSFHCDDPINRRSVVMAKLDKGSSLRINSNDAHKQKIQQGRKVRLIHGDRSLELIAELDPAIPEGVVFGRIGYIDALTQDLQDWNGGFPQVSLVGI